MMNSDKLVISQTQRNRGILLILAIGIALYIWKLGSTGLVDETPPLFASAGRAMSETGDWLTPRVNGLPRYDKPPLVYWLMGAFYSLPGNNLWDPLGTWAARLPSAISSILMMCFLGDTVMRWPQAGDPYPRRTAVSVALCFGLSPLILLWSRTAVSDPLLCATLGISLISLWRQYVRPSCNSWLLGWVFLGLAVLAKGPVSIVLTLMVLCIFGTVQRDLRCLARRVNLIKGIFLALLISSPWYILELFFEGKPFWDSFFGYHNLQRFTSVVNSHLQPWWFFGLVMIIASLPFTPFLFLGLFQSFRCHFLMHDTVVRDRESSLKSYAACWVVAVLLFFTFAATKLPSYWLPAIPASALLIGLTLAVPSVQHKGLRFAWILTFMCLFLLAIAFWVSPLWVPLIQDPEMPSLANELLESMLPIRAAVVFSVALLIGIIFNSFMRVGGLLPVQGILISFCLFTFLPLWSLGDKLRHLPVRQVAGLINNLSGQTEPLAMVGVMKPSLHFYTGKVILYEGRSPQALVNLDDRLSKDNRKGALLSQDLKNQVRKSLLLVIDRSTSEMPYWQNLFPETLGELGIYRLWRLDIKTLKKRADSLKRDGINPDWMSPRPERY